MEIGLLGLSFFNHFTYNVDAAAGVLTLVPNDLAESGAIRGGRSEAQWRAEYQDLRARIETVDQEYESEVDEQGARARAARAAARSPARASSRCSTARPTAPACR